MKLKLFFLGMFAAAAFVSCNNEIDGDGRIDDPNIVGESTSATFSLDFNKANTYAGEDVIGATGYETSVNDASVFVYKWDGANMTPEAMAYLPVGNLGTSPHHLTLMVKNGEKKIFVAVNTGNTFKSLLPKALTTAAFTSTVVDTGVVSNTLFTVLNRYLEATTTGVDTTSNLVTPTTTGTTISINANGIIRTMAGGSIVSSNGVLYSTQTSPTGFCLMTNWDGPNDVGLSGAPTFQSNCYINLAANVTAAQSQVAGNSNFISIGVQRAYAKISLRITADNNTTNTTASYVGPYYSSEEDGSKGRFAPWTGTGTANIWALGGINKRTYPFQVFGGTQNAVASPNYLMSTQDSILTASPLTSDRWYDSYDNTRVFGTTKVYTTAANTVTNVKTAMETATNNLALSPADGAVGNLLFAMCTENGTEFPQIQDRGTYVIVGGVYSAKNVLTSLLQAGVTTNPPDKGWNNVAAVAGVSNTGFDVAANIYATPAYTTGRNDTLYYLVAEKIFIHGLDNLAKYIAWELQIDKDNGSPLETDPLIAARIALYRNAQTMLSYFKGNCFYRVWVRDTKAAQSSSPQDEYLVRRNHVYDININKIKGPGIGDPNQIIIPKKPLPELDTFVTAEINILDWHKVSQAQEVSYD